MALHEPRSLADLKKMTDDLAAQLDQIRTEWIKVTDSMPERVQATIAAGDGSARTSRRGRDRTHSAMSGADDALRDSSAAFQVVYQEVRQTGVPEEWAR